MANSGVRAAPCARYRLARFTQQMSSTTATAPPSMNSRVGVLPTVNSLRDWMDTRVQRALASG